MNSDSDDTTQYDEEARKAREEILLFALQREDGLVNNRTVWVLTLQGLLFAALALSIEDSMVPVWFASILGIFGAVVSIIGTCLALMANRSISYLRTKWREVTSHHDISPFGKSGHGQDAPTNMVGLSFWLPLISGLAWIVVIVSALVAN